MIITKSEPFSKEEIEDLKEAYEVYIKTVIDVRKKICSAGAGMHYHSEQALLDKGSKQADIWGGGIDLETKMITFNSFINVRPSQANTSNEIQDPQIRQVFEKLTKHFFKALYE
ncbi:MAG: hypothetical protein HY430_02325 [Candidatus Levybacteria bacterium]|nr:hypothetical protein [Candidatus Levybacteria bacterium]